MPKRTIAPSSDALLILSLTEDSEEHAAELKAIAVDLAIIVRRIRSGALKHAATRRALDAARVERAGERDLAVVRAFRDSRRGKK